MLLPGHAVACLTGAGDRFAAAAAASVAMLLLDAAVLPNAPTAAACRVTGAVSTSSCGVSDGWMVLKPEAVILAVQSLLPLPLRLLPAGTTAATAAAGATQLGFCPSGTAQA